MTEVFNWQKKIDEDELNKCVQVLQHGGLVIFPTETVYGIGASAYCEEAVKRIYEAKNRPNDKPLSILVSDKNEISKYAIIENDLEKKIIENFMPGPITIILKKKQGVFDYISSGKDTIGIRIPDNEIILQLLKKSGLPIVAPSANISGKPSGIELNEILKDFNEKVDVCIDGGKARLSESSTIVQIVEGRPVILREGTIKLESINEILNK
ncbi:MAG: threonylcarbamoyl-AMP synthase [Clostridia bacterium]|nr:threonylcarbamoyl-AMP synthase [Clostridia bacterium]